MYGQIGNESPDIEDPKELKQAFKAVQQLIAGDLILSGHDRSDGGLIATLLEMAFGGNCGIEIQLQGQGDLLALLFSEELGLVFEFLPEQKERIENTLREYHIPYQVIGKTKKEKEIAVSKDGKTVLHEDMRVLRAVWEETSYHLDRLQADPDCVEEERKGVSTGQVLCMRSPSHRRRLPTACLRTQQTVCCCTPRGRK